MRPGDQVMALGVIEQETSTDLFDLVVREIDLQGSLAYTRQEFELAVDLLARREILTCPIISESIPLAGIEERGFHRLLSAPDLVKIVVRP